MESVLDRIEARGIARGWAKGLSLGEAFGTALGETLGEVVAEAPSDLYDEVVGEAFGLLCATRQIATRMLRMGYPVSEVACVCDFDEGAIRSIAEGEGIPLGPGQEATEAE